MDILDDMGVSKLTAKQFFFKVNYYFNIGSVLALNNKHRCISSRSTFLFFLIEYCS